MRDLAWLKEEIVEVMRPKNVIGKTWYQLSVDILSAVDQIEQPDYNDIFDKGYKDGYKTAKNQLPEQPELPVIPEFVAEYIQNEQEAGTTLRETLVNLAKSEYQTISIVSKTAHYADEKIGDFIDAYRYGYTVEEKKYYVLDKKNMIPLLAIEKGKVSRAGTHLAIGVRHREESVFQLTEKEIKDYDERYWQFAIPTEEVTK